MDYAKPCATLREWKPLLPGNPTIIYNLATSAAAWDIFGIGPGRAPSLCGISDFAPILKRVEKNEGPVASATTV